MELGTTTSLSFGSNLNSQTSKDELKAVAEQFEAIFVEQLLKAARQSNLADGLFDNEEVETYRDMLDKEYAKSIATNTSLGIASAIEAKFSHFLDKE
jgi:flagellar protein FlgJ